MLKDSTTPYGATPEHDNPVDISLVVLTHDRPHGLAACLDSIKAMERNGIACEVVVIDDGSKVDNRDVLKPFGQDPPIVYYKQRNGGVASARNTGIEIARGRNIAFVADDYRLPKTYLTDASTFSSRSPASLCHHSQH